MPLPRPLQVAGRIAPVALAAVTAVLGATLLPFWPTALVAAIVLGAAAAAWVDPRLGLAIALAAPVFPLGNLSRGAAVAYGALALAWLVLAWRDARAGLLFVAGPLLAPLGLLALVPLVVQPARGALRRGALAGSAVLSAALLAGVTGSALPLSGEPAELGLTPLASPPEVASAVANAVVMQPVLLAGAVVAAIAAAMLPFARRRSRYGVLAVGTVLLAGVVATGTSLVAVPLVALVWGVAGALAAGRPARGV